MKYKVNERANDDVLYEYKAHDGERFAIHEIHDKEDEVHMSNEFFKLEDDWVTTVNNLNAYEGDSTHVSLIYSVAIEKLSN